MASEEIKDKDTQQQINENREEINEQSEVIENEEVNENVDLEEQLASEKDRNLRLFAEFENFRKRTARERLELFSTANEDLMKVLLPILDDFDRAIAQMETLGASEQIGRASCRERV